MAMRSVVDKLKALTSRMPRLRLGPPPGRLGYQKPVIDISKFDSLKELNEVLPALVDKKIKAEREAIERYRKAYDRRTYLTAGAGFGATIWFAVWFYDPFLNIRFTRHRGEPQ